MSCETHTTTLEDGGTECVCERDFYEGENGTCIVCNPEDMNCDKEGITLETMDVVSGTWRANNASDNIYDCPVPEACNGGNRLNSSARYCAEGQDGALCASCAKNWFRRGSSNLCKPCSKEMSQAKGLTVGVGVGALAFLLILVAMDLRFGWTRAKGGGKLKPILNAHCKRDDPESSSHYGDRFWGEKLTAPEWLLGVPRISSAQPRMRPHSG